MTKIPKGFEFRILLFMIPEIKKFFKDNEADIILVVGIVLISLMSFGGGWLMGINSVLPQTTANEDIKIEEILPDSLTASTSEAVETMQDEEIKNPTEEITTNSTQAIQTADQGEKQIVASKNGEAYYYIWCSGAKRIKEENKVYFSSKEEAEKAGYRPAKTCPGLEE